MHSATLRRALREAALDILAWRLLGRRLGRAFDEFALRVTAARCVGRRRRENGQGADDQKMLRAIPPDR